MWDFVMDKGGAGAGFLRELLFPLPIYIPSASPQLSSLSPEAGTIGQEWQQCQQPHQKKKNKKTKKQTNKQKTTQPRIKMRILNDSMRTVIVRNALAVL
jgi:hypothetical protein